MSTYTPDKWILIKLTNKQTDGSHYRVYASWYGGYAGSDSWKMNSGITKATLVGDVYEFEGSSGSVYQCHKGCYGTSGYSHGVLVGMIRESAALVSIELIDEDTDFLTLDYTT